MRHYLYIGKTTNIPKDESGQDFDAVYCFEKGQRISSDVENDPKFKYYLIVLQKTNNEIKSAIDVVESEWKDFTDLPLELELITDDEDKMQRNFKSLFLNCSHECVIFKSQVVGFFEESEVASKRARKLLLQVSTKKKWMFWK